MTQYTPAQAREIASRPGYTPYQKIGDALRSLADQVEELQAQLTEERLQQIAKFGELQNYAEENAALKKHLEFIERWAVHHAAKPKNSAEQVLGIIAHYPPIKAITNSYADGYPPETYDPYEEIAQLKDQLEAVGAGGVQRLVPETAAAQTVDAMLNEILNFVDKTLDPQKSSVVMFGQFRKIVRKHLREPAADLRPDPGAVSEAKGFRVVRGGNFEDETVSESWSSEVLPNSTLADLRRDELNSNLHINGRYWHRTVRSDYKLHVYDPS